ncbi:DNA/RNA endonuclease G [Leucobacter weissii]|uniref:DNA/RNA endonuclease G n=1 Tax=Leucobacter weissii TaxID=1983706 RepID=A0A939MJ74_9MICO|nr:DNA/RNA endonuclease G [Leucobacter weissii]MBO1901733.1 DNA/RNA endonuclease G [Leucobacter weissii]
MTDAVLKRVVRRETHSPRTVATVIVLIVAAAAAVLAGIEIVRRLLGAAPLLWSPGSALGWLAELPELQPAPAAAAGALLAAAGIGLLWFAVAPGRLARHRMEVSSHAVVVDNGVIASAVAEQVRREFDLSPGGVVVGIGHRAADVTVRPEPGQILDPSGVRAAAEASLAAHDLSPRLAVRARVRPRPETGAAP